MGISQIRKVTSRMDLSIMKLFAAMMLVGLAAPGVYALPVDDEIQAELAEARSLEEDEGLPDWQSCDDLQSIYTTGARGDRNGCEAITQADLKNPENGGWFGASPGLFGMGLKCTQVKTMEYWEYEGTNSMFTGASAKVETSCKENPFAPDGAEHPCVKHNICNPYKWEKAKATDVTAYEAQQKQRAEEDAKYLQRSQQQKESQATDGDDGSGTPSSPGLPRQRQTLIERCQGKRIGHGQWEDIKLLFKVGRDSHNLDCGYPCTQSDGRPNSNCGACHAPGSLDENCFNACRCYHMQVQIREGQP